MAIYRKEHVQPYLKELENYYQQVRCELLGSKPSQEKAQRFNETPEAFTQHYCEIDFEQLDVALKHFKVTADSIKLLKNKAAKPLHNK